MRLNSKVAEDGAILGDIKDTTEFKINIQSQPVIIDSLINLYEDPVGSIVREITSNCVDAHKEKDLKLVGRRELTEDDDLKWFSKKNVIEIEYINKNSITNTTGAFIFRDFGVGLSEARIKNIFTVFGSSTKRDDNEEIGGFGLGSKSPFALTNTFFIRTRRNGTETLYLLSRGETVPTMDKISENPTEELNGTEVIIPTKNSRESQDFIDAINRQLTYFPELVFVNMKSLGSIVKSQIIFETDDFILDSTTNYTKNHAGILIGNVEYPLNAELIGLKIPDCAVKYKFDVGVLDLVPSREAIRYTENTKNKIIEKIKKVDAFAKAKVKELIEKETDFRSKFLSTMTANDRDSYKYINHFRYGNASEAFKSFFMLCRLSSSPFNFSFKFNSLTIPENKVELDWLFASFDITEIKLTAKAVRRDNIMGYSVDIASPAFYLKNDNEIHSRKKDLQLLKVEHPNTRVFVCKKHDKQNININIKRWAKDSPEEIQKNFEKQEKTAEMVLEHILTKKYSDVPDYIDDKIDFGSKTDYAALRKQNGKIFFRKCIYSYNVAGTWSNHEEKILTVDTVDTIYGFEEDRARLVLAHNLYYRSKPSKSIIRIAKRTANLLINAKYVGDVLKKDYPDIKDFANKVFLKNFNARFKGLKDLKNVDSDVYNEYIKLVDIEKSISPGAIISESDLDDVLKHLDINKSSLLVKEYVESTNKIRKYLDNFPLYEHLGLHTNSLMTKNLEKDLKEYVTLLKESKKININQEQIKI